MDRVYHALFMHAGGERCRYTRDLIVLCERKPTAPLQQPNWLLPVETPLVAEEWSRLLRQHPDEAYKQYVLEGLHHGFCIGFRYGSHSSLSAKRNMRSSLDNPEVVDQYLAKEVGLKSVGPSGTLHAYISDSQQLWGHPQASPTGEVQAYLRPISAKKKVGEWWY